MRLSVLMSVYHKESSANLRQCLDSLVIQTLPADEVVIVEDGPIGEQLEETIAEYTKSLPIVSLRLPVNVGLGSALRAGLNVCKGEYVARMDSDDICIKDRFQLQMEFLQRNPEIDVLGSAIAEFDEDPTQPRSIRRLPTTGPALKQFAWMRNPLNHMTVMFKKSSVLAAGGYQSCSGFEDYHLWARMLSRGFHLQNMNKVLVYARCGDGMQGRRGGFSYFKRDIIFQLFLYKTGFLTSAMLLRNILLRAPIRLMPASVRSQFYKRFLRMDAPDPEGTNRALSPRRPGPLPTYGE